MLAGTMAGMRIPAALLGLTASVGIAGTLCGAEPPPAGPTAADTPATQRAAPAIRAASPDDLSVMIGPMTVDAPGGKKIAVDPTRLIIAPPVIRDGSATGPTPPDLAGYMQNYDSWPGALSLTPKRDENGTMILGGYYRMIDPESIAVTSADGSKTFTAGQDYVVNPLWGQIANVKGKLGKAKEGAVKVAYKFATQRLDLIQVDAAGKASVKQGEPASVCPALPKPDENQVAVAGVYVAPWKRDGTFVVAAEDLFPITPIEAVAPVNAAGVAKALTTLRDGKALRVAFLGDSVTLGAEAGSWWDGLWTAKNKAYASRVVVGLRDRFPKATVEGIAAFKGGTTTKAAAGLMDQTVIPGKANLVVVAFGLNDANGSIGKPPNNPPESYKQDIRAIIRKAKEAGMEVLLVTPMQPNPWMKNDIADRIPAYRQALLELAKEENVACADVYSAWMNQAKAGTPPFSQLHNWINHPGEAGHKVYADTLLAVFR